MNAARPTLARYARVLDMILTVTLGVTAVAFVILVILTANTFLTDDLASEFNREIQVEANLPPSHTTTVDGEEVRLTHERVLTKINLLPHQRQLSLTGTTGTLITILLAGIALWHLRQFVHSLSTENPFIAANATRLRYMAWITVAIGVWRIVFSFILSSEVAREFPHLDLNVRLSLLPPEFVFAVVLFIIAEVFSIGVKMKAEQDLTI